MQNEQVVVCRPYASFEPWEFAVLLEHILPLILNFSFFTLYFAFPAQVATFVVNCDINFGHPEELLSQLNSVEPLRNVFHRRQSGKVYGPHRLFLQLIVHLLLGFRSLRDIVCY